MHKYLCFECYVGCQNAPGKVSEEKANNANLFAKKNPQKKLHAHSGGRLAHVRVGYCSFP